MVICMNMVNEMMSGAMTTRSSLDARRPPPGDPDKLTPLLREGNVYSLVFLPVSDPVDARSVNKSATSSDSRITSKHNIPYGFVPKRCGEITSSFYEQPAKYPASLDQIGLDFVRTL